MTLSIIQDRSEFFDEFGCATIKSEQVKAGGVDEAPRREFRAVFPGKCISPDWFSARRGSSACRGTAKIGKLRVLPEATAFVHFRLGRCLYYKGVLLSR